MPARSGHAHSEDLPWLEVPHPVPAAEEESDSGVSLVPPICGEAPFFFSAGMRSRQRIKQNGKTESCIRCFQSFLLFFPSHSNKRSTRGSRAPPLWCSPTPEDGRCAPSCALLRIKCSRNEL